MNYIALISGLLLSGTVSAGAFTVQSADGCPWVRNDSVVTKAPTTRQAEPVKTTRRTLTLEEAVELGVIRAPVKRTTNPFVRNG